MKRWEFGGDNERRYRMTVECDGQDCDGPIRHGLEEFEVNYEELATRIGLATIRHGEAHTVEVTEGEFNTHVLMVFSNDHEEGFSRTMIGWHEI